MRVKLQVPEEKKNGIAYQVPARIAMECIHRRVQKNIEGPSDGTQAWSGEKWRQKQYRSACGQEWTQYWLRECESGVVSEGIMGKENHQSHQNQTLHVHEL